MLTKKLKLFITPHFIFHVKERIKTFDIIHLHEYYTFQNVVIRHYAKRYKLPFVLQVHGSLTRTDPWRRLKLIYHVLFGYKLLRDASKVIALNKVEAEQYMRIGGAGKVADSITDVIYHVTKELAIEEKLMSPFMLRTR